MLVERGVPVNVADNAGRTPLHVVAEVGFPDVLLFLLDHLADLAALDNRTHKLRGTLRFANGT